MACTPSDWESAAAAGARSAGAGARHVVVDADTVGRAEAALRSLSDRFAGWMAEETARLDGARLALNAAPHLPGAWDALQTCAHDLKGLGATCGYPLATRVCASLGRLLDDPAHRAATPLALIDAHVDVVERVGHGHAAETMCAELEARVAEVLARRR